MEEIYFNGKLSYTHMHALIEDYKLPFTSEETEEVSIDGRNGKKIKKLGTYPNKEVELTFNVLYEDYYYTLEKLDEWLSNIKDNRLMFTNRNKCYLVENVTYKEIENPYGYITLSVVFTCYPFLYLFNERVVDLSNITTHNYFGNAPGEPKLMIYGNGTINLTFNDEIITFYNVENYVELDSKERHCKNSTGGDILWDGNFPGNSFT